MPQPKILIVEDEPAIVEVLAYNLAREGFDVSSASDGQQGLQRARTILPDLVILDLMLPVMEGLQVCRQLRSDAKTQNIRILMLTAKGEETDELVGFHMGADDYVTKPFRVKPLVQRVKALLRRKGEDATATDVVAFDGIEMNRVDHTATLDEEDLNLTPTEFRLLWTLVRQPGRTFSRGELMDCCRGEDANSLERTIDVHIRALRKKLGRQADSVKTVRGVGYRMKSRETSSA